MARTQQINMVKKTFVPSECTDDEGVVWVEVSRGNWVKKDPQPETNPEIDSSSNDYATQYTQIETTDTNDDEMQSIVEQHLDELQSTPEERLALKQAYEHKMGMKDTGEWEEFDGDIAIGKRDESDEIAYEVYSELEMKHDKKAYECECNCDMFLSKHPIESRHNMKTSREVGDINKKTQTTMYVDVTTRGENYTTGTSEYGKVYIPNQMMPEDTNTMKIRAVFKGYEQARGKQMPWRCLEVLNTYVPLDTAWAQALKNAGAPMIQV